MSERRFIVCDIDGTSSLPIPPNISTASYRAHLVAVGWVTRSDVFEDVCPACVEKHRVGWTVPQ